MAFMISAPGLAVTPGVPGGTFGEGAGINVPGLLSIRPHACASHPSVVVIQHGLINISNINSKFDVDVDVDVR